MKRFVLLLGILLAPFFNEAKGNCSNSEPQAGVISSARERNIEYDDCKQTALLPIRTAGFSSENSSISSGGRINNSARRTQNNAKSSFRIVKAGKVIDKVNVDYFQTSLHQFQSGQFSKIRYIHTICHLLI